MSTSTLSSGLRDASSSCPCFSTAAVCRRTALAPDSRAGRQRGFGIPSCFPTPSMAEAIASCPKSRSNTGLSRVIPRRSRSRALAASRGAVCI